MGQLIRTAVKAKFPGSEKFTGIDPKRSESVTGIDPKNRKQKTRRPRSVRGNVVGGVRSALGDVT